MQISPIFKVPFYIIMVEDFYSFWLSLLDSNTTPSASPLYISFNSKSSISNKISSSNKSIFLHYLALMWITGIFPPIVSKFNLALLNNSFSTSSGMLPYTSILFIATIIGTFAY